MYIPKDIFHELKESKPSDEIAVVEVNGLPTLFVLYNRAISIDVKKIIMFNRIYPLAWVV